jgi:predicted dehydrogenase
MRAEGTSAISPRVAVVGCGQIADAHLHEAARAGARVVAVCDRDGHLAEQAAARFGVPRWFSDLGALLAEARPDVVHVTTPPATHLPIARAALEAGAHAYVEKPFTVDLAEADLLAAAARRHGRRVCAGHNLLYDPAVRELHALVADGAVGEVVHVQATMGYDLAGPFGAVILADPDHWVHRLPGGLAQNNLSHPLSLVLSLLGDGPVTARARGLRHRPQRFGDVRDRFHDEVRIELGRGRASASVQFSCRIRPVQLSLAVYGTRSTVAVSLDARTVRAVRGSRMPGPFAKVDWARNDAAEAWRALARRTADLLGARLHYFEGMADLFRRFYASALGDGVEPVPLESARAVTAVMDEVFRACAEGERATATAAEAHA